MAEEYMRFLFAAFLVIAVLGSTKMAEPTLLA